MRINLNLATRPYRDVRQFLMTWGIGALALAAITVALGSYTFYAWRQSRSTREQISELHSEISKLDGQRAKSIALLNLPQNRDVASQSVFLNELIARRSFSLTRLFMELERIMPARLRVLSISPSLNKQNQIEIHMLVGGDAHEQAEELVKRLENSPSFREPSLRSESFGATSGDRVQFDIASVYVPQSAPDEKAKEEKDPEQQTSAKDKKAAQTAPAGATKSTAAGSQIRTVAPAGKVAPNPVATKAVAGTDPAKAAGGSTR